ncbi:MAG: HIT family protein [Alphaproteobacteria bacterium]|nr:HIT family protein [Alphaproteobacteria bacterium]
MAKFGFPDTLVAEADGWAALVRPQQVTLGAMVLVCQEPVGAFGQVSAAGFAGLGRMVARTESALKAAFNYDKINFVMLMMVDPDVHFHVVPRYAGERMFSGQTFQDAYWPKPPDLTQPAPQPPELLSAIRERIRSHWPREIG